MGCPNKYETQDEFEKAFFESDKDSDICNGCGNLAYVNGIATCVYFNKKGENK